MKNKIYRTGLVAFCTIPNAGKKSTLTLFILLFMNAQTFSQYEKWDFQGYSIGLDATGTAICAMGAMPEVTRIGSQYYMYYIAKYGSANAIYYATSANMIDWDVQDTVMVGSSDTSNRIYDLGGPGILKLSSGQYRLFYRTSQKMPPLTEPLFHIRSMISNDGINFTHEAGVRVENSTYDVTSYFKSASHPAIYKDGFGLTRAIITGRDTSMSISSPAGLYTASSPDEGLTWTGFTPLYSGCHDPVVVKDQTNKYHMYTSLFGYAHREAVSIDGVSWPVIADSMTLMQGTNVLTEQSTPYLVADLGAGIDTTGKIVLYSNYRPAAPGPWRDIAYYFIDPLSDIKENAEINSIVLFPNPVNNFMTFKFNSGETGTICLFTAQGQLMYSAKIQNNSSLNCENWNPGIYFYTITKDDKNLETGKIIKQ